MHIRAGDSWMLDARCPHCRVPFDASDKWGHCDHEAGTYRDLLHEACKTLQRLMREN